MMDVCKCSGDSESDHLKSGMGGTEAGWWTKCSLFNSSLALINLLSFYDRCLQEFSGDSESYHVMRVAVYQGWEEQSTSSYV